MTTTARTAKAPARSGWRSRHPAKPRRRTELGLLVMGWVIVVFAYVLASIGTSARIPTNIGPFLGVMIGLSVVAHLANRFLVPDADPVILPIVALLNGLGWVMIARLDTVASVQGQVGTHLAYKQAAWTAVGVLLYVATLAVFRRGRDLERYRYLIGLAGIALLVSPLFPVVGKDIYGSRLWLYIGPLHIQPVELAKLALVIFFASYFAEKREMLAHPTLRIGNHLYPDPRTFGPILVAAAFAVLIIAAEHDIGFAL
ncbi:MAG: FtsW/RodA/SpoVE family cell cycle protein, partial [Acidimicrobiales bacterium]